MAQIWAMAHGLATLLTMYGRVADASCDVIGPLTSGRAHMGSSGVAGRVKVISLLLKL